LQLLSGLLVGKVILKLKNNIIRFEVKQEIVYLTSPNRIAMRQLPMTVAYNS